MKKLILILSFFLLGCTNKIIVESNDNMIVTDISYYNNSCLYTIKLLDGSDKHYGYNEFTIYDTCRKYQVGDTIKFIRKHTQQ